MSWGEAWREAWRNILSDSAAALALLGAALLYSFYYPVAYRHQVATQLPIAVVDEDHSALSREIVRSAQAVRAVRVVATPLDLRRAAALLEAGEVDGILLIPRGLGHDVLRGEQGHLLLHGNAAYLIRNAALLGGLGEMAGGAIAELAERRAAALGIAGPAVLKATQPVKLVTRPLYNTRDGYGSYVVPAVAVLIAQQVLMIGAALIVCGVARGRGWSAMRLGAHALAFWLIGMLTLAYFLGFVFWFQDYPRGGNALGALVAVPLFMTACVGLAMWLGSIMPNRARTMQVLTLTSVPFFFLSGTSWPHVLMPEPLVWVARLIPTTPGIQAMLKLNQMGASLAEVLPELLNLAALALLFWGLALHRLRAEPVEPALDGPALDGPAAG
ncbi:ABC transporter [Chitiniphilus shinanonensis]|uniref:ABC transporter n=1 Tax=Chitiniphilus shinanonensis TaxID=553088 RepID=A0ABQ6C162_9NEIS|nr:ABC transporter permease [Chitiniphilus shinanonensis]GLS05928.1 ABC transporter [Chitiniphilus shinanonensis]